jgi:cell division transport system permease protein
MSGRRHEDMHPVGFVRYCLEEARTSIARRWRVTLLAVLLIASAVFVVGAAMGASSALKAVTHRMTEAAELSVYLARAATPEQLEEAGRVTREDPAVASAEVFDPDRAAARVAEDFPDLADVITALPEQPFGAVVEARLAASATQVEIERLVKRVRGLPGVDDVIYDRDVLRRVLLTVTTVRRVMTGLAALLALAAFAIVAAVLRLGYYARRDEIEVLGLLGAPPRAIAGPFVVEGMLQAAAGAMLAVVALLGMVWAASQGPAAAWARMLDVPVVAFASWQQMLTLVAVATCAGAVAGWVGARETAR